MSPAPEGPMALYRRRVAEGALDADPAQRLAVEKLQLLAMRLADYNPARPKRVGLGRFGWGRDRLEEKPVPGLYLYGDFCSGELWAADLQGGSWRSRRLNISLPFVSSFGEDADGVAELDPMLEA